MESNSQVTPSQSYRNSNPFENKSLTYIGSVQGFSRDSALG